MRPWTIFLIVFAVTFAMTTQAAGADEERRDGKTLATYARPFGPLRQSRSVVVAKHGMVATSHPLAAQTGLAVLQQGGNAADAAIATCAVLGVVEPMSCGLGGDVFVIYWDNKTQRLYGLNGSGRSPFALSRDVFTKRALDQIPIEGPLAWSVPGCVDGWDMLRERFGSRSWGDLLAAAIATADDGFAVSARIADRPPARQAAIAAVLRIGQKADHRVRAQRLEERAGRAFRGRHGRGVPRRLVIPGLTAACTSHR